MKGIILDELEQRLFCLLTDCVQDLSLPVTLRVAGGWVRDKLLGLSSHDIDIAIDQMMGRAFAERFTEWLHAKDNSLTDGRGVGVVKSNPERSKHLETACVHLFGIWIDFVNLRSESYADSQSTPDSSVSSAASRIPLSISFGTALEDALRRDITINTLFYNLHSGQVEDFTGRGLSDLHGKLIRTPLDPVLTLLDDPLRLLRVIRFAARFHYALVPELLAALHNERVHSAFRSKVSRERVGIEVDKMVSHESVMMAMSYILHEKVYSLVVSSDEYVDCDRLLNIYKECIYRQYPENSRLAALCALHIPLCDGQSNPKRDSRVLNSVRDGLKLPTRDFMLISRLIDNIHLVLTPGIMDDPVRIGRTIIAFGAHWRLAVYLVKAFTEYRNIEFHFNPEKFISTAHDLGLADCHEWKCLLNGNDVRERLNVSDGRQVGAILAKAMDMQLANPRITKEGIVRGLLLE